MLKLTIGLILTLGNAAFALMEGNVSAVLGWVSAAIAWSMNCSADAAFWEMSKEANRAIEMSIIENNMPR